MNPFVKIRPLTAVLCLVNALIALAGIAYAWHGTQSATLLATPATAVTPPQQRFLIPAQRADVAAIQEAPLFYESRRFFVASVAPPTTPPLPSYTLVGTFSIPNKPTLAFLKSPLTGAGRKVSAGETLDGWIVELVESRRIVLRYQSESREILAATHQSDSQPPAAMAAAVATPAAVSPGSVSPTAAAAGPAAPSGPGLRMSGGVTTAASWAAPMRHVAQGPGPMIQGKLPKNDPSGTGYVNPGQPLDVARAYRGPR